MEPTSSPFSLAGKVAIVTGAARGIGRAIADAFLAAGAQHVVCADILSDTLAEIEPTSRIGTAVLDVTDEAAWQSTVDATLRAQGQIDILVNNAGILTYGTIAETSASEARRVLDVNVIGVLLGMQAVIPHMKTNRRGAIINTSSASGLQPSNFVGAYAASKWAVRGLTRAASLELGMHGIRVNSIHPGGVFTQMANPIGQSRQEFDQSHSFIAMQRGADAEEIARGVTFLASDAASYCTGTELAIDGGMTAGIYFPGLPGSPANP